MIEITASSSRIWIRNPATWRNTKAPIHARTSSKASSRSMAFSFRLRLRCASGDLGIMLQGRPFEGGAVPMAQLGAGLVGALEKGEQRLLGLWLGAEVLIFQQKFAEGAVVTGAFGLNSGAVEALRRGRGVAVEGGFAQAAVARPEAGANHFMGVG